MMEKTLAGIQLIVQAREYLFWKIAVTYQKEFSLRVEEGCHHRHSLSPGNVPLAALSAGQDEA